MSKKRCVGVRAKSVCLREKERDRVRVKGLVWKKEKEKREENGACF